VTESPKRLLRLRLRLHNLKEVERWVLSLGAHATVVRPCAMKKRLAKVGGAFAKRYASEL
jgi:hypothetical protein